MDAILEARTAVEHSLQGWLKDGETLMATALAADVELTPLFEKSRVITTITGHIGTGGPPTITSRSTRRSRPSGRRRSPGRNGAGGTVTGEQLITFLQTNGPANQSRLAEQFKVSRATIRKRLESLGGQVFAEGAGTRQMWHARELAAA